MIVKIENVELRSWEKRISSSQSNSQGYYGLLFFEDESGQSLKILCRNINLLQNKFKKGDIVDLYADLNIGRYTNFELIGINEFDIPFNNNGGVGVGC